MDEDEVTHHLDLSRNGGDAWSPMHLLVFKSRLIIGFPNIIEDRRC